MTEALPRMENHFRSLFTPEHVQNVQMLMPCDGTAGNAKPPITRKLFVIDTLLVTRSTGRLSYDICDLAIARVSNEKWMRLGRGAFFLRHCEFEVINVIFRITWRNVQNSFSRVSSHLASCRLSDDHSSCDATFQKALHGMSCNTAD